MTAPSSPSPAASSSAVVVYSGGLDSTVLLCYAQKHFASVAALSVNYAQRHARELAAAIAITGQLGIPHQLADLTDVAHLFAGSSSQTTGAPVPDGHYSADTMKRTVVPNRNMILLSLATGWAVSRGAQVVLYGAHAGDHAIYPDCRPEFVQGMQRVIALCDWHPVALQAPFLDLQKADIVRMGHLLGAPLGATWSCYRGGDRHCGTCGTCVERIEAFDRCAIEDPTAYVDRPAGQRLAARGGDNPAGAPP